MVVVSLSYRFRQKFKVPANVAFAWCTDFGPEDGPLFGDQRRRTVKRLDDGALILTDLTQPKGRKLTIHRLVRIDPDQLAWTNTHLDGPYKHSQYWYRVGSDGPKASHLDFVGLRLVTVPKRVSPKEIAKLTKEQLVEDSALWRERLAPALEAELRR